MEYEFLGMAAVPQIATVLESADNLAQGFHTECNDRDTEFEEC